MQAISFVPSEEPEVVEMFKRWTIAYPKTLMCHLRENEDLNAVLAVRALVCCTEI